MMTTEEWLIEKPKHRSITRAGYLPKPNLFYVWVMVSGDGLDASTFYGQGRSLEAALDTAVNAWADAYKKSIR